MPVNLDALLGFVFYISIELRVLYVSKVIKCNFLKIKKINHYRNFVQKDKRYLLKTGKLKTDQSKQKRKSVNPMFDEKSRQELKYYVYMLLDPTDNKPFYVGKGIDNRVFNHLACVLTDKDTSNAKYDKIREIVQRGQTVKHIIVRHGLSESEAFQIEASLIDTLTYCGLLLSNIVGGHNSIEKGLMTSEEIIRLYNAQPLNEMSADCVLININKTYKRGHGRNPIYQATKETWLISEWRLPQIKYVLSEFRGLIVEVFEVNNWYPKQRPKNKTIDKEKNIKIQVEVTGYGFDGNVAPDEIRNRYINKSVAHLKQRGAAQVIRYNL